ncbi:MAG: hypothetical protein R3342_03355 [Lutibacter sp.]|jgi:hypothetical protein|uniref:hypothetical protein n=1 Tax=Lutibacter sp. TaxID=1925666 RepID=UPI00299D1868|nr:hypothetical protein [Lutibacter sp.]MDX1828563.1 hypothetical protein [Lutibacter sp.]
MRKLIYILVFLSFQFANAQCAMCRAVVESGDASQAEGLNSGILYLMVFPYLLVGALVFFLIKRIRKHKI